MSTNIYESRISALERRVEVLESQQTEIKQFERTLLKRDFLMTTVQIITMVLAIFGAGGFLGYQNTKLIEQMDKRFEQMEKRFDDLKQVVISDRKLVEKK